MFDMLVTWLAFLLIGGWIAFNAFPKWVRKQIGRRDNWTCQNCGRRFWDGWMVHAAHIDEDEPNPDTVENGRILCVECHLEDHMEKADTAREQGNSVRQRYHDDSAQLLRQKDWRTRAWRQKNRQ